MREAGYAVAVDELEVGLTAAAAPIRSAHGDIVASMSISGPTFRLTDERLAEVMPLLVAAATEVSHRLGLGSAELSPGRVVRPLTQRAGVLFCEGSNVANSATGCVRRNNPGGADCEGDDRVPDLYVDGSWVSALAGGRRTIICPADGVVVGEVDEAGPEDTAAAIAAAYRAFHDGPWPATSARERGDLLLRTADLLERDADAVAEAESDGHRQAAGREQVRRRRRRLGVPPLRPDRRRGRPAGSSTPATPTWSAGSSTSRWASAG